MLNLDCLSWNLDTIVREFERTNDDVFSSVEFGSSMLKLN